MYFLDNLIRWIRYPLDLVRARVFGVTSIKGKIRGDINRVKDLGRQYKSEAARGVDSARGAKNRVKARGGLAGVVAEKKKRTRGMMGFFRRKPRCQSCEEKLHPSWDRCPYCGTGVGSSANEAPQVSSAPSSGGGGAKSRTMALDMSNGVPVQGSLVAWLVPVEGPQTGELFQLKPRSLVGTATECDIVLRDGSISSRHAELISTGGGFRLADLGSTNGTYVNDRRITTHDLVDNDTVRLGRTHFKYKSLS